MSTSRERAAADRFFADLMGLSAPRAAQPTRTRAESVAEFFEQDEGDPDLKSGRVVIYDEDSLICIEGWTRANSQDVVVLINRGAFKPIREDGQRRSRAFDDYLRARLHGESPKRPHYVVTAGLHTAPLNPKARSDWDDEMINQLIAAGRRLTVQSVKDQWTLIDGLFNDAKRAAEIAGPNRPAQEFVGFMVLDTVKATLTLTRAANVKMVGNHAEIPLGQIKGRSGRFLVGGDDAQHVIGDIHTHVLLDRFIDLRSTQVGTRQGGSTMHNGVSDVDIASAKQDQIVVYAIDSRWLHRANPRGKEKDDTLARSGNVLRTALRIFGGELE
jgi:hypothetical protein